ncbi:MAG: DUF6364 family protein [Propionibacteriaceae bacterium]|jgi:hypothetical protein|nr:DUF6364 family protein [Propionibacteriaceae bacterium]
MSNITLTMPPDLVRQARVLAAQRDTSVSGLVSALLESALGESADNETIWAREQSAMAAGLMEVGEVTWSRDEVHSR